MRLSATALAALVALAPALPAVHAWGAAGHEIVATIAQMHLHPHIMPLLCSVLDHNSDTHSSAIEELDAVSRPRSRKCNLAAVATWADQNRMRMRWSAALHYVGAVDDHPPERCAFPGTRGWAGHTDINVLHGIRNTTNLLDQFVANGGAQRASGREMDVAQEALKFLVHFVGDMHQPLHLTGRDRGGNGDKVSWNGRSTNLHSLWDSLLIAKALRSIPRNYTQPLPVPPMEAVLTGTIYDPYIRRIMWEGIGLGSYSNHPGRWENEVEDWLVCPEVPETVRYEPSLFDRVQSFLGFSGGMGSETDDSLICPHAWATPIQKLNCDFIWPAELDNPEYDTREWSLGGSSSHKHLDLRDAEAEMTEALDAYGRGGGSPRGHYLELDTPEYAGKIADQWIVEKLLAQGGIRLAGVLNAIFEPLAAAQGASQKRA